MTTQNTPPTQSTSSTQPTTEEITKKIVEIINENIKTFMELAR